LGQGDGQGRRLYHIPLERNTADGLAIPSYFLVLKRNIERLNTKWSVPSVNPFEIRNLWGASEISILHSESGELYLTGTHSIKIIGKKGETSAQHCDQKYIPISQE
jgi:hypothetical protein